MCQIKGIICISESILYLFRFSIIAEPTVAIAGEWSEESSVEELIWTCLGEIFLVMKKLSK